MDLFDQKKENKSLTSLIFDKIREDILNGRYVTGDKLVEIKLADELGVSRTPVREALKQLELDGLVENIPNRGVVVKGISQDDIEDILMIRLCIEGLVGQWASERISDEEISELEEIYDLMEFYTKKNDVDRIFELNTKFHETLYKATKSRYLEGVLNDFQLFIKSSRNNSLKMEGRLEVALEEHHRILEAIKIHDSSATKEALIAHISVSNANIKSLV
ncbi:GntR family transcriptional regulator [Fusibacter tunisiensis]|uniref:DNA-binding GntR family transcriptional regulator n=1 Tax=Fusibacter tunisiensis TaxID=1008308 RepID=A0ABS2MUD1_9FIRM|nr:GntR family transcriptional regulator [Fusibacter tunisiensis]MBM7563017.1 DNA-binding GntR family transcriptional regulator [Fusibacter tunisiensis]